MCKVCKWITKLCRIFFRSIMWFFWPTHALKTKTTPMTWEVLIYSVNKVGKQSTGINHFQILWRRFSSITNLGVKSLNTRPRNRTACHESFCPISDHRKWRTRFSKPTSSLHSMAIYTSVHRTEREREEGINIKINFSSGWHIKSFLRFSWLKNKRWVLVYAPYTWWPISWRTWVGLTLIWGVPPAVGRYCSYLLPKQGGGTSQI